MSDPPHALEPEGGAPRAHASRRWRRAKPALVVVVAVLAVLVPLSVRTLVDGRAELAEARAAEQAGELDDAILHYGRAARWRMPLAGHDEHARERIEALALAAEARDDHPLALEAWRELRSSLHGTRSLTIADPEQLARANEGIVRAMIETSDPRAADPERWRSELDRPAATDSPRTRLAALAFTLWLVAVFGFGSWGLSPKGKLTRRGVALGIGAALLFVIWLILM